MHIKDNRILEEKKIDRQYFYGKTFYKYILTLKFFSAVMFLLFLQAIIYYFVQMGSDCKPDVKCDSEIIKRQTGGIVTLRILFFIVLIAFYLIKLYIIRKNK